VSGAGGQGPGLSLQVSGLRFQGEILYVADLHRPLISDP